MGLDTLSYVTNGEFMAMREEAGELARDQRYRTWHLAEGDVGFAGFQPSLCGLAPHPSVGIWMETSIDPSHGGRFLIELCTTCERLSKART